jgi:hypothetical protein
MAQADFRDALKAEYGFANWPTTRPARSLATRTFVPRPDDLGPFVLQRRRALPDHRNAYIDTYTRADDPEVQLMVTIIEHETPEQAHEGLIDFLTNVMAPTLPTAVEQDINAGDVGFAGFGESRSDVFFVRGPVFIRVQSIGPKEVSVKDLAERLDRHVQQHFA